MQVRVIGVGNLLMGDEGVGVRVVEYLVERGMLPEGVEAVDGGTGGLKLIPYLEGVDRVVVVDAFKGNGRPGSIYRFDIEEIPSRTLQKLSLHEVDLREVFSLFTLMKGRRPAGRIVGIEPGMIAHGMGLTPEVEAAIPKAADAVLEEVRRCMNLQ